MASFTLYHGFQPVLLQIGQYSLIILFNNIQTVLAVRLYAILNTAISADLFKCAFAQ